MPGVRVNNVGGHGGSQRATFRYFGVAEKPNPSEIDTDLAGMVHLLERDYPNLRSLRISQCVYTNYPLAEGLETKDERRVYMEHKIESTQSFLRHHETWLGLP